MSTALQVVLATVAALVGSGLFSIVVAVLKKRHAAQQRERAAELDRDTEKVATLLRRSAARRALLPPKR